MPREGVDLSSSAQFPSPDANGAIRQDAAELSMLAAEGGMIHEQPWEEEKLWSDSESDDLGDRMEEYQTPLQGSKAPITCEEVADATRNGSNAGTRSGAATPAVSLDLLAEGGYIDAEVARPPALADWISFGASEACEGFAAAGDKMPTQQPRLNTLDRGGDEPLTIVAPEVVAGSRDIDEDSFCSSAETENSDADSETRLAALVARVAIQGEESRSALIVQALVRGRTARRFAATQRGRLCAQESVVMVAEHAAKLTSMSSTVEKDAVEESVGTYTGDHLQGLTWLARKERQRVLSDSFESSDSNDGTAALVSSAYNLRITIFVCLHGIFFSRLNNLEVPSKSAKTLILVDIGKVHLSRIVFQEGSQCNA